MVKVNTHDMWLSKEDFWFIVRYDTTDEVFNLRGLKSWVWSG